MTGFEFKIKVKSKLDLVQKQREIEAVHTNVNFYDANKT